jgi:hypothetical protein
LTTSLSPEFAKRYRTDEEILKIEEQSFNKELPFDVGKYIGDSRKSYENLFKPKI